MLCFCIGCLEVIIRISLYHSDSLLADVLYFLCFMSEQVEVERIDVGGTQVSGIWNSFFTGRACPIFG